MYTQIKQYKFDNKEWIFGLNYVKKIILQKVISNKFIMLY